VQRVLDNCGQGKENADKKNKQQTVANQPPVSKKQEKQPETYVLPDTKKRGTMLDSAPDSERSLPSGIGSEFNDLQSANSSLGAKAALDKFEINLNEIQELNRLGGYGSK
jgi:adenine specific DNA methylase Mod